MKKFLTIISLILLQKQILGLDNIFKVKYDQKSSFNETQIQRLIQSQFNSTFNISPEIQIFKNKKKGKFYFLFIVSTQLSLDTNLINDIVNQIKKSKCEGLIHIKLIKNNIIEEDEITKKTTRNLKGNIRGNSNKEEAINKIYDKSSSYSKKYNLTGKNVKIGIFDSGINNKYSKCNLQNITNFTDEEIDDYNGHGTFVSSIICRISPGTDVYFFKIFNKQRKTFSSWIYKAINLAINLKIKILNFSFGGINFDDYLITSIIKNAVSNGVIIVSAAGNDGPSFGTINYPGNLPFVLTVGGLSENLNQVSPISSRGPALHRYSQSYLNKPDVWTLGENIKGINHYGEETLKSGTSMSCGIITGFLSIILSKYKNFEDINLSIVKKALFESSFYFQHSNKYELSSKIFEIKNVIKWLDNNLNETLQQNDTTVEFLKPKIDFTYDSYKDNNFIYDKRYLKNFFYSTMQPLYFTSEILNYKTETFYLKHDIKIINNDNNEKEEENCVLIENQGIPKLKVINGSYEIYTGLENIEYMIQIQNKVQCRYIDQKVSLKISHIVSKYSNFSSSKTLDLNLILHISPIPNRLNRIIFDVYHNLYYPFDGLIPKDNLHDNIYAYDWTLDSLFSNYYNLYKNLVDEGYFVEELKSPLDCVKLKYYSVLIFADIEKNLTDNEIKKLRIEYENKYLSIMIISDWSNHFIQKTIFREGYTEGKLIGGSNIYNLNNFLNNYGIELGYDSITQDVSIASNTLKVKSGTSISKFPSQGILLGAIMSDDKSFISSRFNKNLKRSIVGLTEKLKNKLQSGRMFILTDSYCIDDYQMKYDISNDNCFWLVKSGLKYLNLGIFDRNISFQIKPKLLYDYDNLVEYYEKNLTNILKSFILQSSFSESNHFKKKNNFQCFSNITENNIFEFYNHSIFTTLEKTNAIPNMNGILYNIENYTSGYIESFYDLFWFFGMIIIILCLLYCFVKNRSKNIRMRNREKVIAYTRLPHFKNSEFPNLNNNSDIIII